MSWLPIGPDFVLAARDPNWKRLSRRNEAGRQCLVSNIAIDPTDATTIYVVHRPTGSGNTGLFRTRDDGKSWTPIGDGLKVASPNADPTCVAVNPDHPNVIYLATGWDGGLYVSNSRGDAGTWSPRAGVGGFVRKLVIDTRTSTTLATTVLYAATSAGVFRSADGGATWGTTPVVPGNVLSLVGHTPAPGTARFYAGVYRVGIYHATDPSAPSGWSLLNGSVTGLPAHVPASGSTPENFDYVLVDLCRKNPTTAYAWVLSGGVTQTIWKTTAPTTSWSSVAIAAPVPSPWYGTYALSFAVAPNSPGDGATDILLFGNGGILRSLDSGMHWKDDAVGFHADQHAIAFVPEYPAAGTTPTTYIGCDGGLAKSSKFADPATAVDVAPADYNELDATQDTLAWQNLNHAQQSSAVYRFGSDPTLPALTYIGNQDTGVNGGTSSLLWRGFYDADSGSVAMVQGTSGVIVWATTAQWGGFASYRISVFVDQGDPGLWPTHALLNGSLLSPRSDFCVGLDGQCLSGAIVRDIAATTIATAITHSTAAQTVTPGSMTGILVGSRLAIGEGTPNEEQVSVTATTGTTFAAVFSKDHSAGVSVINNRSILARIAQDATAVQISQDFASSDVKQVAIHPTNPNLLYCGTSDSRILTTNVGATAGPGTVWNEIATGRPAGVSISGLAVNGAGDVYALSMSPVSVGAVTSPLFKLTSGSWAIQPFAAALTSGYGKLLTDPVQNNVLYAIHGGQVHEFTLTGGTWSCTDISDGLPGSTVFDLWVGNIGAAASPKVLLRAAVPTRGIFERDVTAGVTTPTSALYLRDNLLDLGYLNPSPDGRHSPYHPTEWVTHYQCADIKIDARQVHAVAGSPDFYQTDPEASSPPLDAVRFEELKDGSGNLPQSDVARVYVQVRNRSLTPSGNVRVWAIYANAAGMVPSLAKSASYGDAFPFWSQFHADGSIVPSLPSDSPWTSLGPPQMATGVDAAHPKVASFPTWTIPALSSGDLGHSCMVAFIHSMDDPIGETTRMTVDEIAPTNRHVGQKNLHIGAPLPPGPGPAGGGPGPGGTPTPMMREFIEFNNPLPVEQTANLAFDLRSLPPALRFSFQLTPLDTVAPLAASMTGIARTTQVPPDELKRQRRRESWWRRILRLILCRLTNLWHRITGRPTQPCNKQMVQLPIFEPTLYEAAPSALVEITGVRLPPHATAAALLTVETIGNVEPGSEYRFEVMQRLQSAEGKRQGLYGGSTYVVRIAGRRKPQPLYAAPSHDPSTPFEERMRIERDGEKLRLTQVPVWAIEEAKKRETEFPSVDDVE